MSSASSSGKGIEPVEDYLMVQIPKDFFFEGMPLPTAIYLKMSPGNYLLIGKKGDKAAFSELHAYHHKDASLFVKNGEYPSLVQHVTLVTEKILGQKNVSEQLKIKFLSGLAVDASRSLENSGFASAAKVQKVSQMIVSMSEQLPEFKNVLGILDILQPGDTKHSMTTCLVSMIICEEMKLNLPLAQEKVAMGALLHDIGMRFVPKEIQDKPRNQWTAEDRAQYEQHPTKGVELLRETKDVPSDVLLIIGEHHELANGTGFPKRLRDVKISPLARIVSLANFYSNLLFHEKTGERYYTAENAISFIEDMAGLPFNKQAFLALKNVINKKHLSDKL